MAKIAVCAVILLTGVWIILCEAFTVTTVVTGAAAGVLSVLFLFKYLPTSGASGIKLHKLVTYALFLIVQIYLSGFSAIKIILSGAHVEIVKVNTQIKNSFLRTVLANSITLTPGTVSLELSGDTITVLCLLEKSARINPDEADEQIKGKLERMLKRAQK